MAKNRGSAERGFTLIELMTVIATLGVLAGLSIATFKQYKSKAAYAVAVSTLRDSRTSHEASLATPDVVYAAVPLTAQTSAGGIVDANVKAIFPGLKLPKSVKFQVAYDPTCVGACLQSFVQVNHCQGEEYSSWARFGNGLEVLLEHVDGAGCP